MKDDGMECREWTPDDIRRYYESGRVTLLTLAGMLGLTGGEVLEILHGPRAVDGEE